MNATQSTLIATLGTEAQVITTALDLLLRQGEPITTLEVLHSTAPGTLIAEAVVRLAEAFQTERYPNISAAFIPFKNKHGSALNDILSPQDGEDSFREIYQRVHLAKQNGRRVHLLVAGGRKLVSIYGMLTAQILFDLEDRLWYLHSSGEFLASKRMHPRADDEAALVPIPVILWSSISPAFCRLQQAGDPFAALKEVEALQIKDRMEACRTFVLGALTPAEERVTRLLVTHGASDQEIAGRLSLSPRTIERHLRAAYAKAADHWELSSVNRTQLVALLNLYYANQIGGKPA